jgi:hypothetical protein
VVEGVAGLSSTADTNNAGTEATIGGHMRRTILTLLGAVLIWVGYGLVFHFRSPVVIHELAPTKKPVPAQKPVQAKTPVPPTVEAKSKPAEEMAVYPREAEGLPTNDIADLVAVLIPPQGFDHLGWDYLIDNSAIRWVTDGVDESLTGYATREGYVRVRVAGLPSTRIRQHREELAWTVTLGDDNGVKFGPKWISIQAGTPANKTHGNQECSGPLDDHCTFNAAQALAAPTLSKQLVCGAPAGGEQKDVYMVSARGKQPALVIYHYSEGSLGASSWIEIKPPSEKADACKPS